MIDREMKKPEFPSIVLCSFLLALAIVWAFESHAVPAENSCAQLKALCESAGFVQGGAKEGKGLVNDCMEPILQGTPQPNNAGKALPQVPPQVVAACKSKNPKLETTPQENLQPENNPTSSGNLYLSFGFPITFATHRQLVKDGFTWGPSDGQFGAIATGPHNYTFYGEAGASPTCAGSPNAKGTFSFTGNLQHVTGNNGCVNIFGPGSGPSGWIFDRDYAGGGKVVPFSVGGKSGWLMPFHGEYHWKNLSNPPTYKCKVAGGSGSEVPCFYASLGLGLSTDQGKTFKVVGQILQPSQPLSVFTGGGKNMTVACGSLVVADANGKHLDNPPPNPAQAYFYLFFVDSLPGLPGVCDQGICTGVARAPYADVVVAALSGDPHQVAKVFRKYDGASPNPWTQAATSDTADLSGTAGKFAPLWSDEPGGAEVLYDKKFDLYLIVYKVSEGIKVRTSTDLIHWSSPIGAPFSEANRSLYYPTLLGETGDPTIGGASPRLYFTSFPVGKFPDYATSVFESVPLLLTRQSPVPPKCASPLACCIQVGGNWAEGWCHFN